MPNIRYQIISLRTSERRSISSSVIQHLQTKMDKNLKQALDTTLESKVYNRALFLKGKWGIGKTHFIKNGLKKYLEEKGYDLNYISLSGVNSNNELNQAILAAAISGKTDVETVSYTHLTLPTKA